VTLVFTENGKSATTDGPFRNQEQLAAFPILEGGETFNHAVQLSQQQTGL